MLCNKLLYHVEWWFFSLLCVIITQLSELQLLSEAFHTKTRCDMLKCLDFTKKNGKRATCTGGSGVRVQCKQWGLSF